MTCEYCESAGGEVLWENALARVVLVSESGFPGFCRVICQRDPNMFRLLLAWLETRGRTRNSQLWGGSSCTPLRLIRRHHAKDLGYA